MRIGDLGRRLDVAVETIRYYEREGLLPAPERTTSNYRIYRQSQAERLRFIVNCRSLDMTLDEIRQLLVFHDQPLRDCGEVAYLLDAHIGHVSQRITELNRLERQLRTLRKACERNRPSGSCGILRSLVDRKGSPRRTARVHTRRRGA